MTAKVAVETIAMTTTAMWRSATRQRRVVAGTLGALAIAVIMITPLRAACETLRVARGGGPGGLGNPFTSVAQPSSGVWRLIFDGLTVFDESGVLQPALALSWKTTSQVTWEFRLRPDVVFHNGQPLNAEAVARSIELLLTEDGQRFYVYPNLQSIGGVRAVDPLTVEVTTSTPDPILPQRLSLLMIVEPSAWHELGPVGFGLNPVGTGSYTLIDWGSGNSRIALTAFPQSWRPPKDVQKIEMLIIQDPTARNQALLSGVVDVVEQASHAFETSSRKSIASYVYPLAQVSMLVFRLVGNEAGPLADRRVREALTYTVNRRAIAQVLLEGDVQPANQPVTPNVTGFNPHLPAIPYDLGRAKALLAEAGFPNGFTLEGTYVSSTPEEQLQALQLIAQDMASVGVKLKLTTSPIQTFFSHWQSGAWGEIDLFLAISDGSLFFDAVRPLRTLSCEKPSPFICNEAFIPKLREIDQQMDMERRTASLQELVADFVHDYSAIWLTTSSTRVLATDRIVHVPMTPQGIAFEEMVLR